MQALSSDPDNPVGLYVDHLKRFVFEQSGGFDDAYYDHRYLYVDDQTKGQCACGLVRNVLAKLLRELDRGDAFLEEDCLGMIQRTTNPSVKGFLAEQYTLSRFKSEGVFIGGMHTTVDQITYFKKGQESIATTLQKADSTALLLPYPFNYPRVDAILRTIDDQKIVTELSGIQVTLQTVAQHADALPRWLANREVWRPSEQTAWQFVWVVKQTNCQKPLMHAAQTRTLRDKPTRDGGVKQRRFDLPAHTEICMPFHKALEMALA